MKGRSNHLQSSDPPEDWVNGSWTVDCVCGVNFDDGEEMVNCDECSVWVHTRCSRYVKGDDIFVCDKCKGKNNRNDSEETEVAQFLVELPTKTMRIESKYASSRPPPNPFRIWTDKPIEERVHVQGTPAGDPALFTGLSSVFTPQLWKCTGYVPKKFNFKFKEFACWNEEEESDARTNGGNENTVDKGAGVLFSLSKKSVLAPVAAVVGMRGRGEDVIIHREVSLKERKTWEDKNEDLRRLENDKKERSLVSSAEIHLGKRKKEDLASSRERTGKKRARAYDKEVDAKNSTARVSQQVVFSPTSDAKEVEVCQGGGENHSAAHFQSVQRNNFRETVVLDVTVDKNLEKPEYNSVAVELTADCSSSQNYKSDELDAVVMKDEKSGVKASMMLESSAKTGGVVSSHQERKDSCNAPVKQEGDAIAVGNAAYIVENFTGDVATIEGLNSAAPESKDRQSLSHRGLNNDISVNSLQSDVKVKTEEQHDGSRMPVNFQSSPDRNVKALREFLDHPSENSRLNAAVSCVQVHERKEQEVDSTGKADELGPCQIKQENDALECSLALNKSPAETKKCSVTVEEPSKSVGTTSNSPTNQRKAATSVGKSYLSSATSISKSSNSDNLKPADNENLDLAVKRKVVVDGSVSGRKEFSSQNVVGVEEREEMPKKTVKEPSKSYSSSASRTLHSSKTSQDSVSKKTMPESKDSIGCTSSKIFSAENFTAASCQSESTGLPQNQKTSQAENKMLGSAVSQRSEKSNPTNFPPSSKANQNSTPIFSPVASNSPATLSDEELALLLHQELNSSPRVPRVPRVRHAGTFPQLASPTATSMLIKRTSSSGGKDHGLGSRRKNKDTAKDAYRNCRDLDDEAKKTDSVLSSHDQRSQDVAYNSEISNKREEKGSPARLHSAKKNFPSSNANASSGPSSSTEANERNYSSARNSPRHTSDDDTGTIGGIGQTLPGLINEIMSRGRRMTYEELCDAVLPHWHNLRKHNGERYAYSSHSQAVLDCLRNRHEWAQLVDRGPKACQTSLTRKRRRLDAEESEDSENGRSRRAKDSDRRSLESQKDEFPKGKRKARKRRLALRGRGIKDVRNRGKTDLSADQEMEQFSDSTDESLFSDDDAHEGEECAQGSEASSSSEDAGKS